MAACFQTRLNSFEKEIPLFCACLFNSQLWGDDSQNLAAAFCEYCIPAAAAQVSAMGTLCAHLSVKGLDLEPLIS